MMMPVWIINLLINDSHLKSLIDKLCEDQNKFWYYSHFSLKNEETAIESVMPDNEFENFIFEEGKKCITYFNKMGFSYSNFNVCVLGDATETVTQSYFSQTQKLILHHKSKFIINREDIGTDISGFLFLPVNINDIADEGSRKKCSELLVNSEKEWDRVVFYQNVQFHKERFYSTLNVKQQNELLFQYLIHNYFRQNEEATLLNEPEIKSHTDLSKGAYALGAASVYFDKEQHKNDILFYLQNKCVEILKSGKVCVEYSNRYVKKQNNFDFKKITGDLSLGCASMDINICEIETNPKPHPILDFLDKKLYTSYYLNYLRFMPARLLEYTQNLTYNLGLRINKLISNNLDAITKRSKENIQKFSGSILKDTENKNLTFAQIQSVFETLIEKLKNEKNEPLPDCEILPTPKFLKNLQNRNSNSKETLDNLQKCLKSEPTVLSLLTRSFLLGTLLALCSFPFLGVLTSNAGNLKVLGIFWAFLIFLLPLIWHLGFRLRRHFLRVKKQRNLLIAQTLLELEKKLKCKLQQHLNNYYDEMISFCEKQIENINTVKENLLISKKEIEPIIPTTTFNQPLFGGKFMENNLVSEDAIKDSKIYNQTNQTKITELPEEIFGEFLIDFFTNSENEFLFHLLDASEQLQRDERVKKFNESSKSFFSDKIVSEDMNSLTRKIETLGDAFNKEPLQKMAAINGMLIRDYYKNVIKYTSESYLFFTTWQKIEEHEIKIYCEVIN